MNNILSINIYGIFVALGVITGFYVVYLEGKRKKLNIDHLYNIAIGGVVAGIIGARLFYVLVFNPGFFIENPVRILMIHQGGLSIQGGLMGAVIFSIIYIKYQHLPFWKIADTFAPGLILGKAVGRIGCDVFGIPMSQTWFWGVEIGEQILHPAQIYESLLNYVLLLLLWNYRDKIKFNGQLFAYYILGYSFNRGFVEFFRENPLVTGQFTVAHLTALIYALIAILILVYLKQSNYKKAAQISFANNKKRDSLLIVILMFISTFIFYLIY